MTLNEIFCYYCNAIEQRVNRFCLLELKPSELGDCSRVEKDKEIGVFFFTGTETYASRWWHALSGIRR